MPLWNWNTGRREAERKRITDLLSRVKVLRIDNDIQTKYIRPLSIYGERGVSIVDYIVAAAAWAEDLPLMTRKRKHFKHIKEITRSPVYEAC